MNTTNDPHHVILVHGSGLDATSFEPVVQRLEAERLHVHAMQRRGYDGRPATGCVPLHVDDLFKVVDGLAPGPVVLGGVGGGGTLALLAVAASHPRLRSAVVHEPLVGPWAPEQHEVITASIAALIDDRSIDRLEGFFSRMLTPDRWNGLDEAARVRALGHERAVRVEAPAFARAGVSAEVLGRVTTPVTWTVGADSPTWRHDAAALATGAGVEVTTLAAAHTPQLEDPDAFAAALVAAFGP